VEAVTDPIPAPVSNGDELRERTGHGRSTEEYEDAHDGHAMRGEAYGRDFAAEELKRRATELRGK
jgi:hypothetical protein